MEVLPRHYLIGIVMFTLMIVGGVSLISMFMDENPSFGDSDKFQQFNSTFNKLDDVTREVNELEAGISEGGLGDTGLFGILNALIDKAWNTLKLLFSSFSFMDSAFKGLFTVFGVPIWVVTIISLLVTIVLAFAIYSAIFQRDV